MDNNKDSVKCLECQNMVSYKHEISINDILECSFCGAELEVISLEPVVVSIVEEEK